MFNNRNLCILGLILSFGLLVVAIVLQRIFDMEPCSLCMAQRYVLLLIGLLFLLSIFVVRFGFLRVINALLINIGAIGGIAFALRHLWIQSLPADQVPMCGPGFDYLINNFPILDAINAIWTGSGDCTQVDRVLGLPISVWTLMAFAAIFLIGIRLLIHKDSPANSFG